MKHDFILRSNGKEVKKIELMIRTTGQHLPPLINTEMQRARTE